MQYVTDIQEFQVEEGKGSAVTLGKFDALHRGHQKLINRIREYAKDGAVQSVVFSFDMHKDSLLTAEERRELLEGQTDVLIACSFTKEIREMEAMDFIRDVLVKKLHARYIVVGTDFHFGHCQRGDARMLAEVGPQFGFQVDIIEKEMYGNREISSTFVRESLREGNVELANNLLGYTYQTEGVVRTGNQIGRKIGFPTMNVAPPDRKILPKYGVYACKVKVDDKWYPAIGNVGVKPTVEETPVLLTEVYLYDYDQDAYGKTITIQFCAFKRAEQKFSGLEELKTQLKKDIQYGWEYFHEKK